MARWKNINGVLQKIAGSVRIDQVLNKLSRNAISNKAVSEKFETVDGTLESLSTNKADKTALDWTLLNSTQGVGTGNVVTFSTNYTEYSFEYYHGGFNQVWTIPAALLNTMGGYRAFTHYYGNNQYEAQIRIKPGSAYIEYVYLNGSAVASGMSLAVYGR